MEKSTQKDPKKKKNLSSEEKKTYIAYSVIGFFSLVLILYAVSDFGSDDKNMQVDEFTTPQGEANKYNSKIEALNGGKEQDTTINGDLLGLSNAPVAENTEEIKQNVLANCKAGKYTNFGSYKIEKTEDLDGFKFHLGNGEWVMIRASGTEPVLRVYSESDTDENAAKILEAASSVLLG